MCPFALSKVRVILNLYQTLGVCCNGDKKNLLRAAMTPGSMTETHNI